MTISRTAAIVMAGAAGLLAIAALFLFFSDPNLTFDDDAGVEVSCDSLASSAWPVDQPLLSDESFTVVSGELGGEADRFAEAHCDRRRTAYAAGMALTLGPAAALFVLSLFPWSVARDEQTPAGPDSTASEQM